MPKKAKELSAIEVKRLVHPGSGINANFAVGGVDGLLLQITPSGSRSWLLRCRVGGRRRHIGLGGYPAVSLSQARERAREARELIWSGIDPVEHKRVQKAQIIAEQKRGLTFSSAVDKYLENKLSEFANSKHRKQWRSTLEKYANPALGSMMVSDIKVTDVQRALEPVWRSKTETAKRLRGRIEAVLAWSTVAGHRSGDNPARWRGNLDAILPNPNRLQSPTHHPALAIDDAERWFKEVRKRKGFASRALEFLAMTAARSGEVRGATWNELDLDAHLWTIPAARMKAGNEHRVPLTAEAVELLRSLERLEGCSFVFPAARGGMLSDASLSACMKRIHGAKSQRGFVDRRTQRPAVPHGLRSTFRDWVAERTSYPREMAELALAHKVGSEVERAYRRSDMLNRRRQMMADWVRFLMGDTGSRVIKLEAGR
jgi:integrase